ncbi:UNKNOWN [Stylonychia lemnae]|uniref:Uncharacterized protein n=1 Tax=Stylonychia lemnae TaxID=5949 RepID=A0A077ZZU7_STYLE|nr:UNKNOWN [Stylonychia lemnae]|eukprot:CDW75420.1 UNKNOWN [Stylonychia lemnae]
MTSSLSAIFSQRNKKSRDFTETFYTKVSKFVSRIKFPHIRSVSGSHQKNSIDHGVRSPMKIESFKALNQTIKEDQINECLNILDETKNENEFLIDGIEKYDYSRSDNFVLKLTDIIQKQNDEIQKLRKKLQKKINGRKPKSEGEITNT